MFRAEHIIIISIDSVNEGTEIEILVLDPRSTSLLPAEAFTPEDLKTVILEMEDSELPPVVIIIVPGPTTTPKSTGDPTGESSNDPIGESSNDPTGESDGVSIVPIVGAVVGVVVLIALVLAVWFYRRRRKNKRYIFLL